VALATGLGVLLGRATSFAFAAVVFLTRGATALAAVGSPPALAGDLALLLRIHRRETAPTAPLTAVSLILIIPRRTPAALAAMRGVAALAGDLALLLGIHCGKAASTSAPTAIFFLPAAASVGSPSAPACDLALFLGVHRRETAATALAVAVGGRAVAVGHFAVPFRFFTVAPLVMLSGLAVVVGGRFVIESRVAVVRGQSTLSADLSHVLTVPAHRFSSKPTCLRRFLTVKLVGRAPLVSGPPTLAGDLALLLGIHSRKTATTLHHDKLLQWKRMSEPSRKLFPDWLDH